MKKISVASKIGILPILQEFPFRPSVGTKKLDHLYSSINHHRATANLSDIVWCMSGGVSSISGSVWWCVMQVEWCKCK